ncbi:MAG: DsbA family oxidoreductase [Vulcanimicrobiaceae bacterium]
MQITYYLDVVSQWCYFADRSLDRVRERFGERVVVGWKLALINDGRPLESPPEAMAWMYRRSQSVSGIATNAAWRRAGDSTLHVNCAVEGLRALGSDADGLRRTIARAALIDGTPIGTFDEALAVAGRASGTDRETLARAMREAEPIVRETTAEYRALPVEVVPGLLFRSSIGDAALLSGLFEYETLERVVGEMLRAEDGYAAFAAANPAMPGS